MAYELKKVIARGFVDSGKLAVVLEEASTHVSFDINQFFVSVVMPVEGMNCVPKENAKGLAFLDFDSKEGFWFGSLENHYSRSFQDEIETEKQLSFNEKDTRFSVSKGMLLFKNENSGLQITDRIALNQKKNTIEISNDVIFAKVQKDKTFSALTISDSGNEFDSTAGLNLKLRKNFNIQLASNSELSISGFPNEKDIKKLKPFNRLNIYCNDVNLNAGNGFVRVNGGAMEISLSSSQFSTSQGLPGAGTKDAFTLKVLQGNLNLHTNFGNIDIRSNNSILNKVQISNGSILDPTRNEILLNNQGVFISSVIALAKISVKQSLIDLTSVKDIKMKTITLDAQSTMLKIKNTNTDFTAVTSKFAMKTFNIDGTLLNISYKTIMMKGTQIIMDGMVIGPKGTVAPTGVGGFCAIPVCPFTGMPHTGNIITK